RVPHLVGDAHAGGAGAVDDHPLVAHPAAGGLDGGEGGGHHHRRGALHVVVERAHVTGVLVEDASGVAGAEVLPVQHGVREQLRRGGDVGVDQVVVALVPDPSVPVADVHLVVEQGQVVGAHVQHHRDHAARVQPGGGDVGGELADGDLDPPDALVADAEDAFGVGGHQQVHVLAGQAVAAQRLLDLL